MTPSLRLLSPTTVADVIDEAQTILETWGVWIEHEEARAMLLEKGAKLKENRVLIPRSLVDAALESVPSEFSLWDVTGAQEYVVGGDRFRFVPGSAALEIWDDQKRKSRRAITRDLVDLARLVEKLEYISFQSTSLISSDVPEELADRYRLYLALQFCHKPVITGTFQEDAFPCMQTLLEIVRGGAKELKEKPLAIFDCCPSAPLNWSRLTTDALIRASAAGIPAELISMPLAGATGPVTLLGSITQHCAESLAGVVIHQTAKSGAPIVYGGSPSIMDMRHGTTPMGSVETQMIDMANAQIGKVLGLPTHAYMGLSDAPWPDYQAGAESTLGAALAALSGINVISGPGMLKFESRQSLAKLVLDNDSVGTVHRLLRGIETREQPMALDLMEPLLSKGHLLNSGHTRKWFREEFYFPGPSVERRTDPGEESDARGAHARASDRVKKLLAEPRHPILEPRMQAEFRKIMEREFSCHGASLPPIEEA